VPHGTETILLVGDEASIRLASRQFPEALGYIVLAAETPEEALRLAGSHSGPIHLLITDMILPGMNGPDLAELLAEQRPNLKCLFVSGHTADFLKARGTLNEGMPLLSKPFSRGDLARKIREVLDAWAPPAPAPLRLAEKGFPLAPVGDFPGCPMAVTRLCYRGSPTEGRPPRVAHRGSPTEGRPPRVAHRGSPTEGRPPRVAHGQ
jgi:CheY-like chemotaxis protein